MVNGKPNRSLPYDPKIETVRLSSFGARRALNYILDIAKNRKQVCTFVWDEHKQCIVEYYTGKEIEIEIKSKNKKEG